MNHTLLLNFKGQTSSSSSSSLSWQYSTCLSGRGEKPRRGVRCSTLLVLCVPGVVCVCVVRVAWLCVCVCVCECECECVCVCVCLCVCVLSEHELMEGSVSQGTRVAQVCVCVCVVGVCSQVCVSM